MTDVKALLAIIAFILSASFCVAAPYAAIVLNADTGEILYSENASKRLHPAGLTKLATLYITFEALEAGQIKLDDLVEVSKNAASEPMAALKLKKGQTITIRDLIRATAIMGANDASTVLAEQISGSERAFTKKLDQTAKKIGMSQSSFRNAHGLTEKGHLTTASDIARLMQFLLKDFPDYIHVLGRINGTAAGQYIRHSGRRLLQEYKGAVAVKTGYTRAAGFNGVMFAEQKNERIITVVFGGKSTSRMAAQIYKLSDLGFLKTPSKQVPTR